MDSKFVSDNTAIDSTTNVILGSTVAIEVVPTDAAIGGEDFYLSDCTASNELPEANANYKSQKLVTGGCMVNLDALDAAIDASIGTVVGPDGTTIVGTKLQFNQFAFVDSSQGKFVSSFDFKSSDLGQVTYTKKGYNKINSEALTLGFKVTCDIVLGDAPTSTECGNRKATDDALANPILNLNGDAGRRRRATEAAYTQTTSKFDHKRQVLIRIFQDYKVTAGTKIAEVSDSGIVVAHSGSGKATDDAESGAVSAAVAIMAGTAVMLL